MCPYCLQVTSPVLRAGKLGSWDSSLCPPCSLNVVPWDHRLLTTILRGQKVAGHARKKGKRELLWEAFTVIRARVDRLESTAQ